MIILVILAVLAVPVLEARQSGHCHQCIENYNQDMAYARTEREICSADPMKVSNGYCAYEYSVNVGIAYADYSMCVMYSWAWGSSCHN